MALPFSTVPLPLKSPTPFIVSIPENQLADLKTLSRLTKLPTPTYESLQTDGRFGVSHAWLADAKKRLESGEFDWRTSEKWINSFPGFISRVEYDRESGVKEAIDVHWAGLLSEREDAVPVLLLHGWPGSFLEFLPIMDLMRKQYTPQTLPYHLIATSMPGYAFSGSAPLDRELEISEVPRIFNQLMIDLGFGAGYIAQGGDVGSRIARILAVEHEACKAVHVNVCPVSQPPGTNLDSLSPLEKEGRLRAEKFTTSGTGYSLEHATRPSTIGLILNSNPVALLAWIGEKFLEWSDVDPALDTTLEAVILYWLTESGARGLYPYRQRPSGLANRNLAEAPKYFIKKPFGYSYFPKELVPVPKEWAATSGNLLFYREHNKGGHFAALEQPELLKADIEDFVKQVWVQ